MPKTDDFEPLHRRSSLDDQDEDEGFFDRPFTGMERGNLRCDQNHNNRLDQLFNDNTDTIMSPPRRGIDQNHPNVDNFFRCTEQDIFGQVDQHANNKAAGLNFAGNQRQDSRPFKDNESSPHLPVANKDDPSLHGLFPPSSFAPSSNSPHGTG